ncbi:family 1 encapsulin nanocompartment shell protein [Actinocorallia lasiicapitis]
MNNLHRSLAPVSDAAWAQIEDEARRTFIRSAAARRVVDVDATEDPSLPGVPTGHLTRIADHVPGVSRNVRGSLPIIELRSPFKVTRSAVDDVLRGSQDSDWQPVKDAAQRMALAEDALAFVGDEATGLTGILKGTSNPVQQLPANVKDFPDAVSQAMTTLRLAGVNGPYQLLLSSSAYTQVYELADHGLPVDKHLSRIVDSLIWAPALSGAVLLSTRGGDYGFRISQDLAIGYLSSDADHVELYLTESLTFQFNTAEAVVVFTPAD